MPLDSLQPAPQSPGFDPFAWHRLLGTTPLPVPANNAADSLEGKCLLITGAGGSIGSALAKRLAPVAQSLILLDTSETALYEIDRDLRELGHTPAAILGSITDAPFLADLFTTHRPEIVLHAAAYKHVPLIEQNPFAAIANNVLGTHTLLEAAARHHADRLLLVSTDKAVAPHSLMGASKRLAELLCLTHPTLPTTTVRLGNVLGSRGSVVPLFLHQLAHAHPLTITHPESRRYFLTLDQAIDTLIESLSSTSSTTLLAPNLTRQIRIVDLARHLIELHASPAEIVFTSLRPGDKLEESLISPTEHWLPASPSTPNLRAIASPTPNASALQSALRVLERTIELRNLPSLLETVQQLVPDYIPTPKLLCQLPESEVAPA